MEDSSREEAISEAKTISGVAAETEVGLLVQGNGTIHLKVKQDFQVRL